jgi:hypothetical protein
MNFNSNSQKLSHPITIVQQLENSSHPLHLLVSRTKNDNRSRNSRDDL